MFNVKGTVRIRVPRSRWLHVYPVKDVREHVFTSDCWCGARVQTVDPETGEPHDPIVIHEKAN